MSYRFEAGEEVQHGIRRMVVEQLDKALASVDGADDDPHAAVHDVRKRCKKIRAVARLARPSLGERYRDLNRHHRDLARRLSAPRDAQALFETVDSALADVPVAATANRPDALREAFRERRDRLAPAEELRDRLREVRRGLELSRSSFAVWQLDGRGFDAIDDGVARVYHRGRKAFAAARGGRSVAKHHEWRKRVKDLWYHARILRPLWPGPMKCLADELDTLAHRLGDDHDVAVLHEALGDEPDLASVEGMEHVVRWLDRRRVTWRHEAYVLGRNVYAESPKRFLSRLAIYEDARRVIG